MGRGGTHPYRLIRVCKVETGHYILRVSSGKADCLQVSWAGKTQMFQPWEFRDWEGLWSAIERRCLMAGLRVYAPRCVNVRRRRWFDKEFELWVEVRQARGRMRWWKRRLRGRINRWLLGYEAGAQNEKPTAAIPGGEPESGTLSDLRSPGEWEAAMSRAHAEAGGDHEAMEDEPPWIYETLADGETEEGALSGV